MTRIAGYLRNPGTQQGLKVFIRPDSAIKPMLPRYSPDRLFCFWYVAWLSQPSIWYEKSPSSMGKAFCLERTAVENGITKAKPLFDEA